jgi:hypothetical protein
MAQAVAALVVEEAALLVHPVVQAVQEVPVAQAAVVLQEEAVAVVVVALVLDLVHQLLLEQI